MYIVAILLVIQITFIYNDIVVNLFNQLYNENQYGMEGVFEIVFIETSK